MKRHPLDIVSLIAGGLFFGLGLLFGLDKVDVVNFDVRWIPAVLLVSLGTAGILESLQRNRQTRSADNLD